MIQFQKLQTMINKKATFLFDVFIFITPSYNYRIGLMQKRAGNSLPTLNLLL